MALNGLDAPSHKIGGAEGFPGEVAGDEELVTGKEDETVDGSRVRKTGEVAADEEVVKTGDNNHVWVYIVILVAAAVISGTVIVISKKSNKR